MQEYTVVEYSTVHCNALEYSTVQYSTVQYNTVQYSLKQDSSSSRSVLHYQQEELGTVLNQNLWSRALSECEVIPLM